MALSTPQSQKFLLTKLHAHGISNSSKTHSHKANTAPIKSRSTRCCSAIAIDDQSSLTGSTAVRWASKCLQGLREEMEDDAIVRSDGFDGFSFAAVLDGHAGFSSVKFLKDELYKECLLALQGGLVLKGKDFKAIKEALHDAFLSADARLLNWLETIYGEDDGSGATATVIFIGEDILYISHVGDSNVVLSRAGKAEMLTSPHRPYGKHKSALEEIKRIREAGGWISNGRICGDIAVSRAFGDMRFKTKKNEMLKKGVQEGRWTEKFVSRVQFNNDLVVASPDIYQVPLGSDAEFILLASDGLWDYMNSSEVVSFVRNQLREHGDIQVACEALAQAAMDRRSQDNISIIIADLGQTDWNALPIQQQNVVYEFGQAFATIGIVSLAIWMTSQLSL